MADIQRIVSTPQDVWERHSTCQVARHERAFGPLKTGGRRVEWYRYGDLNPGPVAENHVS